MKIEIPAAPFAFFVTFIFASVAVLASSPNDIEYPVAELGSCGTEFQCGVYCGNPDHKVECDAFIEKHNLDSRVNKVRQIEFPISELGNCGSREECEVYCNSPGNVEACIDFAEDHDLVDEHEKEYAEIDKKMARLVAEGRTPGGCQSETECINYCMMDEHFDECLAFLEENDLMPERQLEHFKQQRSFKFEGPGGCSGEKECMNFCSKDENFNTCIEFMEDNGFIPQQEVDRLKKAGSFRGPGGCLMEECRTYCEGPDNFQTCIDWAKEHGYISERDYELAKKTGGKGPGGCVGEACNTYCRDHQQECVQFACDNGFMTPEQCQQAERFAAGKFTGPGGCTGPEECKAYCETHPEECRNFGGVVSQAPPSGQPGFVTSASACSQEELSSITSKLSESERRYSELKNNIYNAWLRAVEAGTFTGSFEEYAKDSFFNSPEAREYNEIQAMMARCSGSTTSGGSIPTTTTQGTVCPVYIYEKIDCSYGYTTETDANGCPLPPKCLPPPEGTTTTTTSSGTQTTEQTTTTTSNQTQ